MQKTTTTVDVRDQEEKSEHKFLGYFFGLLLATAVAALFFPIVQKILQFILVPIMLWSVFDEWKKISWKWTKDQTAGFLMLAVLFASFFYSFFADVICLFIAFFSVGIYVLMRFKLDEEKRFTFLMINFIFFGAVLIAVRLHYTQIKLLGHALLAYFS